MRLHDLTARLISSHDALQDAFAETSSSAVHLVVDPRNPRAAEQCRAARRFIRLTLAHMDEEESTAFPRALRCGVPPALVAQLSDEHAELRVIAAALEGVLAAPVLDDDGALALLRFLHRFEQHVQREEWSLATLASC